MFLWFVGCGVSVWSGCRGLALSREKILNNVWNYDYYGDARTIDTHVKKLRKKMGEKGDYIKTIWGMGYKFIVD
jgi:DNA-binding response OmpR family regulator